MSATVEGMPATVEGHASYSGGPWLGCLLGPGIEFLGNPAPKDQLKLRGAGLSAGTACLGTPPPAPPAPMLVRPGHGRENTGRNQLEYVGECVGVA